MGTQYVLTGHAGVNVLDTADQDLIRVRVSGDNFDRVVLDSGGLATGDGTAAPAPVSLSSLVSTNNQTGAAYTLALTDADKVVERENGSANTLTVPTNAAVAFPVGTLITIRQSGAGQTTLTPADGTVNLRQRESKLKLAGQWAEASLIKRAANEWVVTGDVSA